MAAALSLLMINITEQPHAIQARHLQRLHLGPSLQRATAHQRHSRCSEEFVGLRRKEAKQRCVAHKAGKAGKVTGCLCSLSGQGCSGRAVHAKSQPLQSSSGSQLAVCTFVSQGAVHAHRPGPRQ